MNNRAKCKIKEKYYFLFCVMTLLNFCSISFISAQTVNKNINWPEFMARHDMIWERTPSNSREAPWTGNGLLGSMIWFNEKNNSLNLQVFRTDVHDHGPFTQNGNAGVLRGRFQIGSFNLKPVGIIIGCDLRLDIWNAKLTGSIKTDKGVIEIEHFTHTQDPIISTTITPTKGEVNSKWSWHPAKATSTRTKYAKSEKQLAKYKKSKWKWGKELYDPNGNGDPVISTTKGINTCRQTLKFGGEYTTAWKEYTNGAKRTLMVSIAKNYPEVKSNSAVDAANSILAIDIKTDSAYKKWLNIHQEWWHNYYQKSFVSLNDTRAETVYWTQIHKLACATRHNRPMMDTAGPWQTRSPWPYITWDLNVQLCYWLPVASNHIEDIGMSLPNHFHKWQDNLIKNVQPEEWQKDSAMISFCTASDLYQPRFADPRPYGAATGGNLPWAIHDCYMMYEATQDKTLLREKIFPLLRRAVNFQFHLLHKWEDGSYGFVKTACPEFGVADNCNYELAIFRWGCQALLDSCKTLNINDPLIPKWKDALAKLVPYPYNDETGYRVGSNKDFDKGHRHYSHLLHIYPFYLVNIEKKGEKARIRKSIDHFYETNLAAYRKTGKWNVLAGYSLTGLASMYAAIGDGEDALKYLNTYIYFNDKYVLPNGLYAESGPVLETPLSAGQSVLDMLIQSWGDKIRVFPATPKAWSDICFDNLRTKGAFLVSAKRKDGITQFVQIKSLAGQPCKIKLDFIPQNSEKIKKESEGVYAISLNKNESITLSNKAVNSTSILIDEVPTQESQTNWFGLHSKRDKIMAQPNEYIIK